MTAECWSSAAQTAEAANDVTEADEKAEAGKDDEPAEAQAPEGDGAKGKAEEK